MRNRITRLSIIGAIIIFGASLIRADEESSKSANALLSKIDKVGSMAVLQELLADTGKSKLDKTLAGIRSGNEKWLEVLSKLRPTLMASVPAMQFDNAASEALENNPKGILKSAVVINKEWAKLAKTSEQNINYPSRICSIFSADWDEETPRAQLAEKTIPRLKKRKALVEGLASSDVPAEIKNSCLNKISESLEQWEKN